MFEHPRKNIVFADGAKVSIQASLTAYSTPRINGARGYSAVELGYYTGGVPDFIKEYEEGYGMEDYHFGGGIFPYVPAPLIMRMILHHGGIIEGELPPLDFGGAK